ncbi:reverse transcriptase [Gossypium australe]|uniref:Reverse transcriptase n=1 Tax=Gossypium australe TaxID=47621 RepID=A0A5B6V5B5_9ROSI|nr:reverse transcriptase [Gossypium australe]
MAAVGSRGGLCLAWKGGNGITLRSYSKWHIDIMVKEDIGKEEWRFSGFYGSPYMKDKDFAWTLLKRLGQECKSPWLVAGDFNEIMYPFEKKKWYSSRSSKNGSFQRGIRRMSVGGHRKMWSPPEVTVGFHFESWWILEESLEGIVRDCWASSAGQLIEKLKMLQFRLRSWAGGIKKTKGELKRKLNDDLEVLLHKERDDETLAQIIDKKIHLNMEIEKEEMYWEQRVRTNWLKMRDRNMAYFHKCASIRRRGNAINKLVLDDGKEITDCSEITEAATGFFEDLFKSKGCGDPNDVLNGIGTHISRDINDRLLTPFTSEEVWCALKDMGPTKALGSDGFPAIFFQKFWHLVGDEVTEFCLSILNDNRGVEQINVTEIVLIPKIINPSSLVNFRPISLYSVLYKVVAKAIVNRLHDVMGLCIDEVQSAFVPGHLITDNVLVAYEILYTFRKKRVGKKGFMTLKLDMSKAYDRVEWNFVRNVMIQMGFAEEWVNLIMKCVTSVSYTININGCRGRIFQSSRGLRQGDPLSPFLFLFCSEDDCMLFGEATKQGARNIKNILQEYENCSGQCVNFSKSTIFYSFNTTEEAKTMVSSLLGVRSSSNPEKYLGLPNVVGKRKKEPFQNLVDRVNSRIDGWIISILRVDLQGSGGKKVQENEGFIGANGGIYVNQRRKVFVKIAALTNSTERKWNENLIKNTFPAAEAELILQIPLALEVHDDLLVWNGESTGEFSMRSSYKLLQQYDPTAYALHHIYKEFYKKLWRIDILSKIKIFVWKITWNFLATRVNLSLQRLVSNSVCPRCLHEEETMLHLFRDCPVSQAVWNELVVLNSPLLSGSEFLDWLTKSASGIVIRDRRGHVLISCAVLHKGVASAFAAEAIACRKASQMAMEMHNRDVTIEGDSLTIIKKCNKEELDRSLVGSYINDIHKLKSKGKSLSFEFVPRSANNLAHIIATEALKRQEEYYLNDRVPSYAE